MPNQPTTIRGPMGRKRKEVDQSRYSGRVAARLRMLRESKKKTVKQVAKALKISPSAYYYYECNEREIPIDLIPNICKVLQIPVRDFFPD